MKAAEWEGSDGAAVGGIMMGGLRAGGMVALGLSTHRESFRLRRLFEISLSIATTSIYNIATPQVSYVADVI
jgi:hypothetical protein